MRRAPGRARLVRGFPGKRRGIGGETGGQRRAVEDAQNCLEKLGRTAGVCGEEPRGIRLGGGEAPRAVPDFGLPCALASWPRWARPWGSGLERGNFHEDT